MQTMPLCQTTGISISGFRIVRIRTKARSGKTAETNGQDECLKAVKREERLQAKGCGGRRELIVTTERKDVACPQFGSERARWYKAQKGPNATITNRIWRSEYGIL